MNKSPQGVLRQYWDCGECGTKLFEDEDGQEWAKAPGGCRALIDQPAGEPSAIVRHIEYAYEQARGSVGGGGELEVFVGELFKLIPPEAKAEFERIRNEREDY